MMLRVGIEVLRDDDFTALRGQRIGLMTAPSAVTREMVSSYRVLYDAPEVNLVALYGGEHGAFGAAQAGDHVDSNVDPRTGLRVHSLYGAQYRPTAGMLADIDLMVCDIQDIGVRYYTYLWSLTHVVEACGAHGVPVMILDRPNPLGDTIAGCGLDDGLESLVGRYNVPIQHGMTLGEALQLHNAVLNPTPATLTIIACDGYQRNMTWESAGRPFVPTSPNIPTMTSVRHYPGSCLIEGTNLSEGRGTTTPFEIVGAPYVDARDLADALNALDLPDVAFRPHHFTPIMSKHAGNACEGVHAHIMGAAFEPITTWMHVIHTIRTLYPAWFDWRPPWTAGDHLPIDKLIGSTKPRQQFDAGASVATIMAGWDTHADDFHQRRQPYLIYE